MNDGSLHRSLFKMRASATGRISRAD